MDNGGGGPAIVLVGDAHEDAQLLNAVLEELGAELRPVPCIGDAARIALEESPALILVVCAAAGSGWKEQRWQLREAGAAFEGVPLVFLAPRENADLREAVWQLGGTDFISCPLDAREIRARLLPHLKLWQLHRQRRDGVSLPKTHLEALVEHAADALFLLRFDGRFVAVNRQAEVSLGYTREELLQLAVMDVDPDFPNVEKLVEFLSALRAQEPVLLESRHRRKDGYLFPVEIQINLAETGAERLVVALARDVTERKQWEAELAATQERYAELVNATHDLVSLWRMPEGLRTDLPVEEQIPMLYQSVCMDLNRRSWEGFGFSKRSDAVGKRYVELVRAHTYDEVFKKFIANGYRLVDIEGSERPSTGGEYHYLLSFHGRVEEGVLTHCWITAKDITEQTIRKAALERTLLISDEVGKMAKVGGWEILLDDMKPFFSSETLRILGYPPDEMPTLETGMNHFPQESRGIFMEAINRAVEQGAPYDLELPLLRAKGEQIWIRTQGRAVFEDGKATKLIGTFQDITERRLLEERIRQTQKMEAIGTLAGGIAHDFNNILSAILGYTTLAQAGLEEGLTIDGDLKQVAVACGRAKELVHQILTFSRQSGAESEAKSVHLQRIVKEVTRLLRATLPKSIELRSHWERECDPVMVDPTLVHQLVMNLCTNAFNAMAESGGVLDIRVQQKTVSEREAALHVGMKAGNFVMLTVSDTGHGMDPTTLKHVFDPYFTTKGRGEGTGLGLAVVHGIVRDAHGAIMVDSALGKGSTFRVLLPLAEVAPADLQEEECQTETTGNERILFVDDEKAHCEIAMRGLTGLGYEVTAFQRPEDALATFRAAPDAFDVVVTDLTMPGFNGLELSRAIHESRPQTPIVLCSGIIQSDLRARGESVGVREFLRKPTQFDDIARSIRRVCHGKVCDA